MKRETSNNIDQNGIKFGQSFTMVLWVSAFVLDSWHLLVATAALNGLGVVRPALSPVRALYRRVVLPLGLIRPNPAPGDLAPHRFAQGLGTVVTSVSAVAVAGGHSILGWAMVWTVVILAGLSVFAGVCAGCFIHHQLTRLRGSGPRFGADQA